MIEQLNIFGPGIYIKPKKKKYISPDYLKFYPLYQYDREKFKALLREAKEKKYPQNQEEDIKLQNEILNKCYIRDKKGQKLRDCDEAHILRIGMLQRIYEKVFYYTGIIPELEGDNIKPIDDNGLIIHPAECQAEIIGTWQKSIEERIRLHIKLLRLLREGFSVEESIERVIKYDIHN